MPPLMPEPDYAPAITAFHVARAKNKALAFALAISDARWGRGEDIGDPACLRACAEEAGLPSGIDLTSAPEDAAEIDREMIEKDQAFGVPFAALDTQGTTHKFWGQDRFALLAEMLA